MEKWRHQVGDVTIGLASERKQSCLRTIVVLLHGFPSFVVAVIRLNDEVRI